MCIALQEMRAESWAEGWVEGWAEGENTVIVRSICSLMDNLSLSASQAMDALSIPPEERDRFAALVSR